MRYAYLLKLVEQLQPRRILEVGTWNGYRAAQMLKLSPGAKYYGFDLFDEATGETDAEEKNVKPHYSLEQVQQLLDGFGFDATLYRGNTRETLQKFDQPVDFAWIDGGHSVETIRSDWSNVSRVLSPGAAVVFDDYYSGGIDTKQWGCNEIVRDLHHFVVPGGDPVRPIGTVQLVRVYPE